MNIFEFRDRLVGDYASYIESFIQIRDPHIHDFVERQLQKGMLWPDPSFNSTRCLRRVKPLMSWWRGARCTGNECGFFAKTRRRMSRDAHCACTGTGPIHSNMCM